MTFIGQGSFHINSSNVTNALWQSLKFTRLFISSQRPCCVMQIFNLIELKLFCLLRIFHEVAQNSPSYVCRNTRVLQVCGHRATLMNTRRPQVITQSCILTADCISDKWIQIVSCCTGTVQSSTFHSTHNWPVVTIQISGNMIRR